MEVKIITRKPRNASLRFQSYIKSDEIGAGNIKEKSLIGNSIKKSGGRNCYGRITVRHIGGGVKRKYRFVDFNRTERSTEGVVKDIHYDPNRNVPLALVFYPNGKKQYILLPEKVSIGSVVVAGLNVEASVGNCLPIRNIPIGFNIHNIEITPNSGGKLVRSAGASAQILAKEGEYATIKMPSGEMRMLHLDCWATIGEISFVAYKNVTIGKAGRNRNKGIRPSVRGMAMNPIDHPHGGGEGRSKSGANPTSPWGKCCKGTKTRTKKSRFIVKRRK